MDGWTDQRMDDGWRDGWMGKRREISSKMKTEKN